jgi:hypothetical protein
MTAKQREELANTIGKVAPGSPKYTASPALQAAVERVVNDGIDVGAKAKAVAVKRQELATAEADLLTSQNTFDKDMGVCVKTAESVCTTAEELAQLGLKPRAKSLPVPLVVLTNITVKPGKDKGSIYAHARAIPGISQYPAQISADPIGPDTWKTLPGTNAVRRLTGYVSGARYWIRFATQRGDQQSAWSDPVAVIVR